MVRGTARAHRAAWVVLVFAIGAIGLVAWGLAGKGTAVGRGGVMAATRFARLAPVDWNSALGTIDPTRRDQTGLQAGLVLELVNANHLRVVSVKATKRGVQAVYGARQRAKSSTRLVVEIEVGRRGGRWWVESVKLVPAQRSVGTPS